LRFEIHSSHEIQEDIITTANSTKMNTFFSHAVISVRKDFVSLFSLPDFHLIYSPTSFFKEIRNTGPYRTQSNVVTARVDTFRFLTPGFGFRRDWRPLERSYFFTRPDVSPYHCIALVREMHVPDNAGRTGNGPYGRCEFSSVILVTRTLLPNVTF